MAFGKKNHVSLNIFNYNICLLGQSKVGKTTLMKEVCEKTVGENGYLFLEIGQEQGADAIEGIEYINCPTWRDDYNEFQNSVGYMDVVDDIVENKTTEYPNLKTVIIDTYDQLINIAEEESISLWNREAIANGKSPIKSINEAWGGFGRGEKKAIQLMFDTFAQLNSVGVKTVILGHVKNKDVTDIFTGETYQVLTSDQQSNYFNALKKNLHFLGLAYIDREIIKEKTGKKIPGTKKDETINRVAGESRKIKFRDDNYAVDSGSRFADITPEIPMDADSFIKALQDAIKAEASKNKSVSLEDRAKEQEVAAAEREKKIAEAEEKHKEEKTLKENIDKIKAFCVENKGNMDALKPVLEFTKKHGYKNPTLIDDLEIAQELVKLIA